MNAKPHAVVVGAGPAGLMAAERLSTQGWRVEIVEAMPSPGRKFLMAGKSGLNLTMDQPVEDFIAAYGEAAPHLAPFLRGFGPAEVVAWARGLGQKVFTGSTGRVFPVAIKASPLLRAWLARLAEQGCTLHTRWRWTGWADDAATRLTFETPEGTVERRPNRTVIALGGASWRRLGSDGAWAPLLAERGVPLAPFRPANMGMARRWSDHMARHLGQPVKNVALMAGGRRVPGEFVLSARGLEGSGIYALYRELRDGHPLTLDLLPALDAETIARRLAKRRKGETLTNHLRKALGLDATKRALLNETARPLPQAPETLATLLKSVEIETDGPRPLDEAISTAGGIAWDALNPDLTLKTLPNTTALGEMLDWEAPTGGYLITGCLTTAVGRVSNPPRTVG
ncbi:MAG: TIGR03862 family flavoprotein [Pseudomonadota bacterium]